MGPDLTPARGRQHGRAPQTTMELLTQTEVAPIGGALVLIAELPEADAARCHDELLSRAAELYDLAVSEAFLLAMRTGQTGEWRGECEHPRDWVARMPLVVTLAMRAEGWVVVGEVDQEPALTFDQSELDAIAAEVRRTEGNPMIVDGRRVQNRDLEP